MLEKQSDFARVLKHNEEFFLFSFSAYLILPSISFDILTWRKISNFFKTTIEDATLNTMKIICWVMFEKKITLPPKLYLVVLLKKFLSVILCRYFLL